VITGIAASAALAEVSPSSTITTSSTTLYWSGQGAPGGVLGTPLCGADANPGSNPVHYPNGGDANNYELWIFTSDGSGTVTGSPTLTVNGKPYVNVWQTSSSTWQIVTPYIDPSTITLPDAQGNGGSEFARFVVNNPGGGDWTLKISHGCAGTITPPPPAAEAPIIGKTAKGTFDTAYQWGITKTVDQNRFNTAGDATAHYTVNVTHDAGTNSNYKVSGDITVNDPNSAPVNITGLTDTLAGGSPQDVSGGVTQLQPGDNHFPYSFDLGNTAPSSTTLDDTATVSWGQQPVDGTSGLAAGSKDASANTGAFQGHVTDATASLTDLGAPAGTLPDTVSVGDFPAGPAGKDFAYPVTYTDPAGTCTDHKNTATVTPSDSGDAGAHSADQTVTVCVGADLTVSKTAAPSFDRTYTWGITKAVDQALFKLPNGTATANYTVGVTHDNGTDGNWKVKGVITVTNPNNWENITLQSLTDAIDNNGSATCTVDTSGDPSLSIPKNGSVDFPYTCAYPSSGPTAATGHNMATATWNSAATSTPTGTASGKHDATFGDPTNIIDGSVSVNDTLHGSLGTVKYTDPSPTNLTYSNTFKVPGHGCQSFPNIATFTTDSGKTGSASQTVQVCRTPLQTGALTMGFWHNKNGQGIISSQAKTGTCPSATWLRQYNPFSDLSATATCAQVASYDLSVFNNASASSTSMNAMLKAQMLSTALDVYFSDSSLGGNKILAPSPVGAENIDLTQICKMIDGSGGTATCSGTYEDASPEFSGSPKTVSDMLAYAASQSDSGGVHWYGNVKATQQYAKDAFDAINNQVAFGA
jgi:hypothetical protein